MIAGALSYLAAAYCSIADLPLAIDELGAGETGYGLLVAAWGVGTTLGAVVARRAMQRLGVERAFSIALFIEGVAIALVAFAPSITLAAIAFIAGGMMGGIGITADQVLVQERVADGVRGRVRAANDAVMAAAYSLSLGVGGFVVVALGPRGTYLVGGLGVIGAAFVGMARAAQAGRAGASPRSLPAVLELTIRPIAPYDLAASARGLGDGTRRFRDGVLDLHLREGHVRVRQRGDGTLVVLADADEAFDRAQFVLGADLDHRPFLELAARDGLLRDIIGRRRGVRVLRTATVAHALLKAMCGQLIQASAAIQLERDVLRMLAAGGR